MKKSFLELVKGDKPLFIINALCGLGDMVSHLSRIPDLEKQFPNHTPLFLIGGYGKSPKLMKDLCDRQEVSSSIIKNYNFHNQHDKMEEFIIKNYVKESRGDIYESWSFCKEIFKNSEPPFYRFQMPDRYDYKTNVSIDQIENGELFKNEKIVLIKPFTTEGNAEGFDHDIKNNRFWHAARWVELIKQLNENGYKPAFIGLEKDLQKVPKMCDDLGVSYYDFTNFNIEETTTLIKESSGLISTNSWEWGIAAKSGIPTICVFLKNGFFIDIHIPHGPSKIWDNLYISVNSTKQTSETIIEDVYTNINDNKMDKEATPKDIMNVFNYMSVNKRRPDKDYSVAMITLDDKNYVEKTLDNVIPFIKNDFVVVDGGSKDGTLEILKSKKEITLLEKKWEDNFETQKNYALDNTKADWRVLIDSDEVYEQVFWNQLPWLIWEADNKEVDCITLPRINIVDGLTQEMIDQQRWSLTNFNWVNYPDPQERVYKRNCRYSGRTHERIVGSNKKAFAAGQHIIHRKDADRQQKGIDREEQQYIIEAKEVKKRINLLPNRKLVVHYLHHLGLGGTAKVVQLLGKYFPKDDEFHHVMAYKSHGELEREPFFEEYFGKDNMIPYASGPEFMYIMKELNPFIIHRQTSGSPEFPFIKPLDSLANHLISTSIFGLTDNTIDFSKTIYISNNLQHCSGQLGSNSAVIGIPVEAPLTDEDLREELNIPSDAFVFGRIGRDNNDIYDPVNLEAFSKIENEKTFFIALNPSDGLKKSAETLGIKNIRWVDRTLDDLRLSKFFNTMDVLAHARRDGECNPGNCWEAMAHGKPIISHYGIPYNGHIEEIGNAGFVVSRTTNFHNVWQRGNPSSIVDVLDYARGIGLPNFTCEDSKNMIKNDVDEYARIMKMFVDGSINYNYYSEQAKKRWSERARPEVIVDKHLELYRSLR